MLQVNQVIEFFLNFSAFLSQRKISFDPALKNAVYGIWCGRWFQCQDLLKSEVMQTEVELIIHLYENYLYVLPSSTAFCTYLNFYTVSQKAPLRLIFFFNLVRAHFLFHHCAFFSCWHKHFVMLSVKWDVRWRLSDWQEACFLLMKKAVS